MLEWSRDGSFADLEYQSKKHKTGRELFLERIEDLILWEKLLEAIKTTIPNLARGESLWAGEHAAGALRPTLLQPQ